MAVWQPLCTPPLVAEVISVPVLWLETLGAGGWTQHAGKDGLASCIALSYRMPWTRKEGQRNRFFKGPVDFLQWHLSIKNQGSLWFKDWTWRWTPRNVNSFVRTAKMTLSVYTQFPAFLHPIDPLLLWHERFSMQRGNTAFQELQILYLMINGMGQAMQGFPNKKHAYSIPSTFRALWSWVYNWKFLCLSLPFCIYQKRWWGICHEKLVSQYLKHTMPLRMDMKPCLR